MSVEERPSESRAGASRPTASWWLAVVGLTAVIIGSGVFVALYVRQLRRERCAGCGVRAGEEGAYAELDGRQLGSPGAKVQVIAALPLRSGCHAPTIGYLSEAARAIPEELCVTFADMQSARGQEQLKRHGLTCAALIFNGSNQVADPAGGKTLLFQGPLGENYSLEDVRQALEWELARAYGRAPAQLPAYGGAR